MSHAKPTETDGGAVPPGLDSGRGKLVYLYLDVRGETDVERIGADLDLPLITLCDVLTVLEERGFVEGVGDSYRCVG